MSELDRVVGGLRCREVLARLSEYLDGDLPADEVAAVDTHLAGCDRCERFGGAFGEVIAGLRRELSRAPRLPEAAAGRLRERLKRSV